jgi:hypothetical protein
MFHKKARQMPGFFIGVLGDAHRFNRVSIKASNSTNKAE